VLLSVINCKYAVNTVITLAIKATITMTVTIAIIIMVIIMTLKRANLVVQSPI